MKFRKFSASYVRQCAQNRRYLFRVCSGYKLGLFRHFRTCLFIRRGAVVSRLNLFSSIPKKMGVDRYQRGALTWTRREYAHHIGLTRRLHPMEGVIPNEGKKRGNSSYYYVAGHPANTAITRRFPRFFVTWVSRAGMRQEYFFHPKSGIYRRLRRHHVNAEKRIEHAFKPRYLPV